MEDLEHAENGTPTVTEDDPIAEQLFALGADDEFVEEVRKGYLRQADYTRKNQEREEKLNAAAEQLLRENEMLRQMVMNGQTGQGQQPQANDVDKMIEDHLKDIGGDDENSAPMRKFLTDFAKRIVTVVDSRTQQQLGPVAQTARQAQIEQGLEAVYTELQPKYGDGLKKLWPSIKQEFYQSARAGQPLPPEAILWSRHQEDALRLSQEAAKKTKKPKGQEDGGTLEGMTQSRRQPTDARGASSANIRQTANSHSLLALTERAMKKAGIPGPAT